jgi:hypothetical protein
MKPKFQDCAHKKDPLLFILTQINPVYIFTCYFFKIYFNIISHLSLGLRSTPYPSCFHAKSCINLFLISSTPPAYPFNPILFDYIVLIIFLKSFHATWVDYTMELFTCKQALSHTLWISAIIYI